ncbi:MAG: hypothetical protein PHR16_08190 [Methylovulum sp.]|nr:hypothetical protein [Methylovulum sp.]
MKKRKNQHKLEKAALQNPVAKFACHFNKSHIFCDKSKYKRNVKHKKQEVSIMVLITGVIIEGFCYSMGCKLSVSCKQYLGVV